MCLKLTLLILIFIFSCDVNETNTNPISNDIEFDNIYKVNLDWSDETPNSATEINIKWDKWFESDEGEIFDRYNIKRVPISAEGDAQATIIDYVPNLLDTTYTIDMQTTGTFAKFYIETKYYDSMNSVDYIYSDTVQFFTQPLLPVTNINIDMNSNNNTHVLNWESSVDSVVNSMVIYRSYIEDGDLYPNLVINISTGEPSNLGGEWEIIYTGDSEIQEFETQPISSLYKYFYSIKVLIVETDNEENIYDYRYSTIAPAMPEMNNSISIDTLIINASDQFEDVVNISWDPYLDDDYYSYEIWRSANLNSEAIKLIEIVDQELNYFEDRYNIGSGAKWYYFMKLYNSYGDIIESPIVVGETRL